MLHQDSSDPSTQYLAKNLSLQTLTSLSYRSNYTLLICTPIHPLTNLLLLLGLISSTFIFGYFYFVLFCGVNSVLNWMKSNQICCIIRFISGNNIGLRFIIFVISRKWWLLYCSLCRLKGTSPSFDITRYILVALFGAFIEEIGRTRYILMAKLLTYFFYLIFYFLLVLWFWSIIWFEAD